MSFDVFICYRRDSGGDFAEHLKLGLERFGVHTFLDIKDIPEKFKGTEKWTDARDNAIVKSKTFLLIITHGFEKSSEIKKELSLARKCADKEFIYFRHKDLAPNLKIILENEELDLGKQQQVSFDTKHDLLRKAYNTLIERQKVHVALGKTKEKIADKKLLDAISKISQHFTTLCLAQKRFKKYIQSFSPPKK